jgi:hypothetical protein
MFFFSRVLKSGVSRRTLRDKAAKLEKLMVRKRATNCYYGFCVCPATILLAFGHTSPHAFAA